MYIALTLLGLGLNLVGSLVIAFSVIENPAGAYQQRKGKKVLLAAVLVGRFRVGVGLLILGFIIQLIASLIPSG